MRAIVGYVAVGQPAVTFAAAPEWLTARRSPKSTPPDRDTAAEGRFFKPLPRALRASTDRSSRRTYACWSYTGNSTVLVMNAWTRPRGIHIKITWRNRPMVILVPHFWYGDELGEPESS